MATGKPASGSYPRVFGAAIGFTDSVRGIRIKETFKIIKESIYIDERVVARALFSLVSI
jgi:hypothetical protein